jgi:flavin reductase (DIM6/NTAB) family NADH-FMN oxidoreductase RutF
LFSIWREANRFVAWQQAERYAINVLSEDQEELSNKSARAKGEKWIGQTVLSGKTGLPLLPNAVLTFECEAYDRHDGGDHEIFVGRVVGLHENRAKRGHPLVFFGGPVPAPGHCRGECAGRHRQFPARMVKHHGRQQEARRIPYPST